MAVHYAKFNVDFLSEYLYSVNLSEEVLCRV